IEPMKHDSRYPILHAAIDSAFWGEICGLVELLIKSKVDVNLTDSDEGCTALHRALKRQNDGAALILLQNGADPNIVDKNGFTAFHVWVQQSIHHYEAYDLNDTTVARQMLESGLDLRAIDQQGRTLLHVLAEGCYWDQEIRQVVGLMLKRGVDLGVQDNKGRTVLHALAESCRPDWPDNCGWNWYSHSLLDEMISSGLDLNARDLTSRTAFQILASCDCKRRGLRGLVQPWVEEVLASGADLNATDDEGRTPVHVLAEKFRGRECGSRSGLDGDCDDT
ncbi:hypothetical protein HDU96_007934, partial [Phlyctochytrium bullatum]